MRLFVAVFPPPELAERLGELIQAAREPADGISWVRPENLHYTLRFLGEVEESRAAAVLRAASEAVRGATRFPLVLGAAGAFPDFRRPRVIWMDARQGAAELEILAKSLEVALSRERFGRAEKPFRTHLTLGRVRQGARAASSLERLRAAPFEGRFVVDRLSVVASTLRPAGSEYRILGEAPLAAASAV